MPEIKATEQPLMDILDDKYIFSIPPFQRPYAWTTEETGELLDDLLHAMQGIEEISGIPPYFLGSIVIIKGSENPLAEIIDGQQRLTTLTILLCVLRELSDNSMGEELDEYVWQKGKKTKGTEDVFRVTLRERDKRFFREKVQMPGGIRDFLSNETPDLKDSRLRIYENTKHLWLKLSGLSSELLDRLAMFVIQRCYLVVVSTSDINSAYRVFAVMNDRGLDLSPKDILKAQIIGEMNESDHDDYTRKWEDIEEELDRENFRDLFAHIRMIFVKNKMRGTLQQEFSDYVLKSVKGKGFIDGVLTQYAEAYKIVTRATLDRFSDEIDLNRILQYLNELDNFDWIPPAMAFVNRRQMEPEALLRFVRDLERLAYGMFIQRADVNERINRYARVLHAIENDENLFEGTAPLQLSSEEKAGILQALKGPIFSIPRVPRPLLLRLDSLLTEPGATYHHNTVSVEHVLPQSPDEESTWASSFSDQERDYWTHRLANLVLLSRRKNSQAQNYDFDRKKKEYFQRGGVPTFALTVQVVNETEWTPQVLQGRQKNLINA